jgi:hypothetical protein
VIASCVRWRTVHWSQLGRLSSLLAWKESHLEIKSVLDWFLLWRRVVWYLVPNVSEDILYLGVI